MKKEIKFINVCDDLKVTDDFFSPSSFEEDLKKEHKQEIQLLNSFCESFF